MKILVIALCCSVSLFAQDKKPSKDDQIRQLQIQNENLQIEADYHNLNSQQTTANAQLEQMRTQLQAQIAPLSTKLNDDMTKARKDQNIPDDWNYNVDEHAWKPPVPQKAPDGSPAKPAVPPTKPEQQPETKK